MSQATDEALGALSGIAATNRGLSLLVLFGSRARRDSREGSDWDLGYLAGPEMDTSALLLDVVTALGTDRVDLVDLARAGAQVRFRAAAEGRVVYAADQGTLKQIMRRGSGSMPPYPSASLSDADLEAVVAYLRSLK